MLDMPHDSIKKIEITNPEILPTNADGKQGSVDLKMHVDDKVINVEIQLKDEGNFRDRSLYYWSKMYADEIKSGDEYNDLKETITINILNFNLFECKEFYSTFMLREVNRGETLTEKCRITFFELKKINKNVDPKNRKMLWLQLIDAETEEDLDMLNKTGVPEIQKAVVILHEMSLDERLQEEARLREKWTLDRNSAIGNAKREGIEEGIKEGLEKAAQNLRESGMSEEQIKKILYS